MKTVGILTVHHYHNYGSALQAYATQFIFDKMGYETSIIDYRSPELFYAEVNCLNYDFPDDRELILLEKKKYSKIKYIILSVLNYFSIPVFLYKKMRLNIGVDLYKMWLDNLNLSRKYYNLKELYSNPPIYDIYVIGSDQVWNTFITYNNPAYFLSFVKNDSIKIAFSTSIGIPFIPDNLLCDFKKGLCNFTGLLLRETEAVDYVESLGFSADQVLDPTLMLSQDEWMNKSNRNLNIPFESYIFAYFLHPTDWCYRLLSVIQKKTSLPIVFIGCGKKISTNTYYTGPIEVSDFLTLISRSTSVVTNSFHGMAFALNFNKLLFSTYRSDESDRSMNSRHRTLIDLFSIESNVYLEKSFDENKLSFEMNYEKINSLLKKYRENTLRLLRNIIDK